MLNRTFEWFRIVDANPPDGYLENRSKSVEAQYAKLAAATTNDDIAEAVAIIISGANTKTPFTDAVLQAIRDNQPAFPSDLEEGKIEVQAFAGLLIQTLLGSTTAAVGRKQIAAASILETGLSLTESKGKTYLEKETAHLLGVGRGILASRARTQHTRVKTTPEFLSTPIKEDAEIDVTLIENLRKSVVSCVTQLQQQATLDEEELNILWWLYGGYSDTTATNIANLNVGAAAYTCGFEVADLSLAPPVGGIFDIISRAIESGRKPTDLKPAKLAKLVAMWKEPVNLEVLSVNANQAALVKKFPMLFPISWLGGHLESAGVDSNWKAGFTTATGVSSDFEVTPSSLAHQLFRERTGLRFFAS